MASPVAPPAWRLLGLALQTSATPRHGPRPGVCSGHGGVQDRRCAISPVDPGRLRGLADAGGRVSFGGLENSRLCLGPTFAGRLFRQLDAQWKVLFTVLAILSMTLGKCGGAGSDFDEAHAGLQLDRQAAS